MNLAVDIGNTQIKVGLFAKNVLQEQWRLSGVSEVLALVDDKNVSAAIVSSVKEADDLTARVPSGVFTLVLNGHTALPFVNHYLTPHTLGTDRVAAVAGAQHHLPRQNTLVIDAGTCITYDLIDRKAQYQGGLISPGLTMRLRAMHTFTARLPLVSWSEPRTLSPTAQTTEAGLHGGAVLGASAEIAQMIRMYADNYPDLHVIICGGDAEYLLTQLRRYHAEASAPIVHQPELILTGLNSILQHHVNQK